MKLTNELLKRDTPLVMAHRGNKTLFPENTLISLADAVELGVDVLEVDTRLTHDRELVIFHDDTLERTTNGKGSVSDKTLDVLKQLDAGYWFTPDNGSTFPYRDKKLEIPTLREAFERFPETIFNIDIKISDPVAVDIIAALIREYHREDTVLVASFHDSQISKFRSKIPTVKTAATPSEVKQFLYSTRFHLVWLIRPKYSVFQVPLSVQQQTKGKGIVEIVTPRFIQQAHSKGIAVMVWTINDPVTMRQLIMDGIDGIFTDNPLVLINVIHEMQAEEKLP